MKRYAIGLSLTVALLTFPTFAAARGPCDGFSRCRCGTTQARYFHLPYIYRGHNLKQAIGWKRAFPHVAAPAVGLVVYQRNGGPTGHVSRITAYSGGCTATVTDDAGTYERNICKWGAVYVDPRQRAAGTLPHSP